MLDACQYRLGGPAYLSPFQLRGFGKLLAILCQRRSADNHAWSRRCRGCIATWCTAAAYRQAQSRPRRRGKLTAGGHQLLIDLLGKTAIPHMRVKPEILGGLVVRTGDTIYDGSLRRRLEQMRRQLLAARLPSGELV